MNGKRKRRLLRHQHRTSTGRQCCVMPRVMPTACTACTAVAACPACSAAPTLTECTRLSGSASTWVARLTEICGAGQGSQADRHQNGRR
jgi:hypothetical protein